MIKEHIPKSIKTPFRFMLDKLQTITDPILARPFSIMLTRNGTFNQPEDEAEASRDMSVIVTILDSPKFLIRCLRSLEMYAPHAEIILVDDGSTMQETLHILQDFHNRKNWLLIRNEKSLGHSRACEIGTRLATRSYLCLLNSDTVVTPWSWSAVKRAFESEPSIAVIGPSTSWAVTEQVITVARCCRHYWNDSQIFTFAQKYIEAHKYSPLVDLHEISGFAFFIRREVWENFGGFDENLPDYGNESELCIRLLKSGWRLVWTRNSYIHHFGRASYREMKLPKIIHSQAYIKEKHGD